MHRWSILIFAVVGLSFAVACGDENTGGAVPDLDSGNIDTSGNVTGQRPVADAGDDVTAGVGEQLSFDASKSFDPDGGDLVSYNWDLGDGHQTNGAMIEHTFNTPGSYKVTLEVIDDEGLRDSDEILVQIDEVIINAPPSASITAEMVAIMGETFEVSARNSSDDNEIVSYAWLFGDEESEEDVTFGNADDNGNAEHVYEIWGPVTVALEVEDAQGFTDNSTLDVLVLAPPVAVMEGSRQTVIETDIMLSAESSFDPDGRIVDYAWTVETENSTTNLGVGPVLNYSETESGGYNVFVTVTDDSGLTNKAGFKITVALPPNELPTADCGDDPIDVVVNTELSLDGRGSSDPDGTIEQWEWELGDGSQALEGMLQAHTYTELGEYTLALTVTDDRGGQATDTCTVNVVLPPNAPPVANCGPAVRQGAINDTLTFDGSASTDPDGNIVAWDWDFGDMGDPGEGSAVIYSYTEVGDYTVTLTVSDDRGAIGTATCSVNVGLPPNVPPAADCGPSSRQSVTGEVLDFDGSDSDDPDGNIVAWDWNFGDDSEAEGAMTSHSFDATGEYTVTLTVTDERGGQDSAECRVTTMLPPNMPPIAVCAPGEQTIEVGSFLMFDGSQSSDPDGTIANYRWDFDDGTPEGAASMPNHLFSTVGEFDVELTVTDNRGGTSSDICAISVTPPPNQLPNAVCGDLPAEVEIGEQVTFDGSQSSDSDGDVVEWAWDPGDGSGVRLGETVTHSYDSLGEFIVTLTVTDNRDGEDSTECNMKVVAPNVAPVADCGELLQTAVVGEEYQLDGSGSSDEDGEIVTWFWDFGDGTNSTGETVNHTYENEGNVTVALTVTDDSTATHTIECVVQVTPGDNEAPIAVLTGPTEGMVGENAIFIGRDSYDPDAENPMEPPLNGLVLYHWNFGDGQELEGATLRQAAHSYGSEGVYVVTLTVTDEGGATGSAQWTIQVSGGASIDGSYALNPVVSHSCGGLINFTTGSNLTFTTGNNNALTVATISRSFIGGTAHDMTGSYDPGDGSFSVSHTIPGGGFCDETFELTGTMNGDGTWDGTMSFLFVGGSCGAVGCADGSYPTSGTLQ